MWSCKTLSEGNFLFDILKKKKKRGGPFKTLTAMLLHRWFDSTVLYSLETTDYSLQYNSMT